MLNLGCRTLVVVPGFGFDGSAFDFLPRLASRFAGVRVFDPHAAPENAASALGAWLASPEFPPEGTVALGWSWGACLLLEALPQIRDKLAALVLISPTRHFADTEERKREIRFLLREGERQPERMLARFRSRLSPLLPPHRLPALRAGLTPGQLTGALRSLEAFLVQPAEDYLPTLVVHGGKDRIIPPEHSRDFPRSFKNLVRVEFPEAGHLPFREDPERFLAEVEKFLFQGHYVDKALVARRFSRAAAGYGGATPVQQALAAQLADLVREWWPSLTRTDGVPPPILRKDAAGPREVLEIGCGSGHLTERLAELYPGARIRAIDLAPGMIAHCRQRFASQTERLRLEVADGEEIAEPERYDLVISNATFQWFNELPASLVRIRDSLAPGGVLACSLFGAGSFRELRDCLPPAFPLGQPLPVADELHRCLERTGYRVLFLETRFLGERYPGLLTFLKHLQQIGAGNARVDRDRVRLTPRLLREAVARYESLHQDKEGCLVRYETILLLAQAAPAVHHRN